MDAPSTGIPLIFLFGHKLFASTMYDDIVSAKWSFLYFFMLLGGGARGGLRKRISFVMLANHKHFVSNSNK